MINIKKDEELISLKQGEWMEENILKDIKIDNTIIKLINRTDELGSQFCQINSKYKQDNIVVECEYQFSQKRLRDIFDKLVIRPSEIVNKINIKIMQGKNIGKSYRVEVSMTRKGYIIFMQVNQNNKSYVTFYRVNPEFQKLQNVVEYIGKKCDKFTYDFIKWNISHIKGQCEFEDMPEYISILQDMIDLKNNEAKALK